MTNTKIGFVLLSNSRQPIPSTRIAVLNMFPYLRAAGFDPHIAFEPTHGTETPDVSGLLPRLLAEGFRIVYFQKVHGPSVESLAQQLSAAGVKTVYGVCDLVDVGMAGATDVTIAITDYLRSLYPSVLQPRIRVVHDGIEKPEVHKKDWGTGRGSWRRPLRAVLVTSSDLDRLPVLGAPPPWLKVSIVGFYPPAGQILRRMRVARWKLASKRNIGEKLDYLRFLAHLRIDRQAWDPAGVYAAMLKADIGIIPIETQPELGSDGLLPSWKVKSENRLTMKMCIGLPVIATPIPSYEPVIEQGRNGYLARSRQEWMECLNALRDPEARYMMGVQARQSVLHRYSMEEQARHLIAVLRDLVAE